MSVDILKNVEDFKKWRYLEQLPADTENLELSFRLLRDYSHIPPDKIEDHLRSLRERAWAIFPYACIGRWRFLDLYLTKTPEYPEILSRIRAGEVFLDAGCCFGQVLRQLAFDGAPSENLAGTDLRREFIELGYDLFRDRETLRSRFVTGDALDEKSKDLVPLDGQVDMIHAASLFHLFGWEDQVRLGTRLVRFIKPTSQRAMIFGRQIGSLTPEDHALHAGFGLGRYHHNPETLQKLWDEIGAQTGTKWSVWAEMINLIPDSVPKRVGIRFVVRIVKERRVSPPSPSFWMPSTR